MVAMIPMPIIFNNHTAMFTLTNLLMLIKINVEMYFCAGKGSPGSII